MRWEFGWELGPFEIWDAVGVREVLAAAQLDDPPPIVVAFCAPAQPLPRFARHGRADRQLLATAKRVDES